VLARVLGYVYSMRIYIVGAGGVGNAFVRILARRDFYEHVTVADYDPARAEAAVAWIASHHPDKAERFSASQVDASSATAVTAELRDHNASWAINAVEPGFVQAIFQGAFDAGANYLDMAMSLSTPHPTDPYNQTGVKLGDWQFEREQDWVGAGRLAIVGMGVEPGLSDVFARYAEDELFSNIDELGVRDGANLVVTGDDGNEIFAPSFSIWTTIEECLNPPVIWEKGRGWFTTEPFSEAEVFDFPDGIGPVECVNVEHEEVLLMPRWLKPKRVTFKYGLGEEFISVLKTLNTLGLDSTSPTTVRTAPGPDGKRTTAQISPRDLVAAVLPDPAEIGPKMTGKTCAGVWVTGTGKDGQPRSTYVYHVADNEWTMANYDTQCVVWQTALGPAVALECVATGQWSGVGVLGPEAFDSTPFLDLMATEESAGGYGQPFGVEDRTVNP
jgi:saccharopine dehydrogenase-like NADP-dependent oxidoreductase